jgi:hypothetical protein
MEQRRAIAWAGSIAATGCAGALTLGALLGGFGLEPGQPRDGQVAAPSPTPEVTESGSVPEMPEPLPVADAPASGKDPRSLTGDTRLLAAAATAPSVDKREMPSRKAKIGHPPGSKTPSADTSEVASHQTKAGYSSTLTTRSSLQGEPPSTATVIDSRSQGGSTRDPIQKGSVAPRSTMFSTQSRSTRGNPGQRVLYCELTAGCLPSIGAHHRRGQWHRQPWPDIDHYAERHVRTSAPGVSSR